MQGIKDMVINTQKTNIHRSIFIRMRTMKMTMMIMVTMVRISVTPVLKTLRLICQKLSK